MHTILEENEDTPDTIINQFGGAHPHTHTL